MGVNKVLHLTTEQLLLFQFLLFHLQAWHGTPNILFSLYSGSIFSIFVFLLVALLSFHGLGRYRAKFVNGRFKSFAEYSVQPETCRVWMKSFPVTSTF